MFRWEEELRQSFLQNATPQLWCKAKVVTHVQSVIESTCSDGRADWVWANICDRSEHRIDGMRAEVLGRPTCSRILASLRVGSSIPFDLLLRASGVTGGTFRRHLDQLLDVDLIQMGPDREIRLGTAFKLPIIEICAFEFKLTNWKRAFEQAKRYRTFANRVYVVMPEAPASLALSQKDIFKQFNVGLISHSSDGSSRRLILSRKSPPQSPMNFLQALGLLFAHDTKPTLRPNSAMPRDQFARCPGPLKPRNSTPARAKSL